MAKHLREDEGLYKCYQANVAMRLHDNHGITGFIERTAAADDILHLIFQSGVDDEPSWLKKHWWKLLIVLVVALIIWCGVDLRDGMFGGGF